MTLTPEQFDKLVTKKEFNEFKDEIKGDVVELKEKMDKMIGMLEKSATKDKNHETEHVFNIAAHDRFEKRITRTEKALKLAPTLS